MIITARCNSSRLPNKILMNLSLKTKSIDILINRAKKVNLPIILATSKSKSDNKLCRYIRKKKYRIKIFRGENKNKVLRWYKCFKKYKIQNACIIDGDDIFFDFNIYKKLIKKIGKFDILSAHQSMITGTFTHILSFNGLKKMYKYINMDIDSEMIEPFIKKAKLKKKYIFSGSRDSKNNIRLTLDYKEDLKLIRKILNKFNQTSNTNTIIEYLKRNKEISKINYFREEDWKNNQKKKINSINF